MGLQKNYSVFFLRMKLFYFLVAVASANDAWETFEKLELSELRRIGGTCPSNLPIRPSQRPVGSHITRKLEAADVKVEERCRKEPQICKDKLEKVASKINESNACDCLIDVIIVYASIPGRQQKRIKEMKEKLARKLRKRYGCSLPYRNIQVIKSNTRHIIIL